MQAHTLTELLVCDQGQICAVLAWVLQIGPNKGMACSGTFLGARLLTWPMGLVCLSLPQCSRSLPAIELQQ